MHAFKSSLLDYCNSLFRLQLTCSHAFSYYTAVWLSTNTARQAHMSLVLASLHWLPVLLITFRAYELEHSLRSSLH